MRLDTYVKVVLTVIAAALVVLAASSVLPGVYAQRPSAVKCLGKLVPSAGFDIRSAVNPMYDVQVTCE